MKGYGELRHRKIKANIKGEIFEYDELYLVDEDGEEVYDKDVKKINEKNLFDNYKRDKKLLTSEEVKNIRKKYGLTQKEYALAIGVGEITVHRFEKGSIQTEGVDFIMKLSNNPNNMHYLVLGNKDKISKDLFDKLMFRIKELQDIKKHALVDLSIFNKDNFKKENVMSISENIIYYYNKRVNDLFEKFGINVDYISNLKLQYLLYYVQGIALVAFNEKAFCEDILMCKFGPKVNEVYDKYNINIDINRIPSKINDEVLKIINEVVNTYGNIDMSKLVDFIHEEEPLIKTSVNEVVDVKLIKEYFNKVYE